MDSRSLKVEFLKVMHFQDGFGLLYGGAIIAQPRVHWRVPAQARPCHGSWEEAFLPALPTDGAATDGEATKLSE